MIENIKKKFHPGEFIKDGIEVLDITANQFAIRSGLTSKTVSLLINGKAKVNFEIAQKISAVIGGSPKTWLNLQNSYDLYLSEINDADELENQKGVVKMFTKPVLSVLNITFEGNSLKEKVEKLKSVFNVDNLNALKSPDLYSCCHHKSQKIKSNDKQILMQNVWINHIISSSQKEHNYNKIDLKKLENNCDRIRKLSVETKEIFLPEIKRILNECGVSVIYSPYMPCSNISGFTKWTKNRENVILGISDNGKRLDKFFFTLFHEIGHIIKCDKRYIHFTYADAESNADQFAMNHLINLEEYKELTNICDDFCTISQLRNFSAKIGIDLSIVLGRLAHEEKVDHKDYSKYYRYFEVK